MPPRSAAAAPPSSKATTSGELSELGIGKPSVLVIEVQEGTRRDEERRRHRESAATRDGDEVDPTGIRPVDDLVSQHDHADDRGQQERDERGRDEGNDDRTDRVAKLRR